MDQNHVPYHLANPQCVVLVHRSVPTNCTLTEVITQVLARRGSQIRLVAMGTLVFFGRLGSDFLVMRKVSVNLKQDVGGKRDKNGAKDQLNKQS